MSLSPARIFELLRPYITDRDSSAADWRRIHEQLALYLDLLLKWNARVNLTAIRSPEEIVRRHFGESLFTGIHLRSLLVGLRQNCSTWNNSDHGPNTPFEPICD